MVTWMENGICAPVGFQAAGIHCGIRRNRSKKDLALIYSSVMCTAASTYTLNKVKGAPIAVTKRHLQDGHAQAIICNSGNANTCNANGEEIANRMCELCAQELNLNAEDIIVASTGVIGEPLSITPFEEHMQELVSALDVKGGSDACEGIMTTDTFKETIRSDLYAAGQGMSYRRYGQGERYDSPQHGNDAGIPHNRCGDFCRAAGCRCA